LTDEQERGEVADARGLLHVVSNDDDGTEIRQMHEQLFDLRGADGIERRARSSKKKHLRLDGQGARNAEALLLAAAKVRRRICGDGLLLRPKGGVTQAFFDGFGDGELRAVVPQAISTLSKMDLGKGLGR